MIDYSKIVPQRVATLKPSGIRKFFDVAATMEDVVSLGVGEPDFVTPEHIRNAGIKCILDGKTAYTANYGLIELRRGISAYLENKWSNMVMNLLGEQRGAYNQMVERVYAQ